VFETDRGHPGIMDFRARDAPDAQDGNAPSQENLLFKIEDSKDDEVQFNENI
jgi:hypothetical protein